MNAQTPQNISHTNVDGEATPLSESQNVLENSLKALLEKILTYMEKFIKTKEDLQEIEDKLNDYENLNSLVEIITSIFQHLVQKVDISLQNAGSSKQQSQSKNVSQNQSMVSNIHEEYEQLEKQVQKHESEIRTHIRLEQQLKLYAESIQAKLEESEKSRTEFLDSTKSMINNLKRDNQNLSDEVKTLKEQNKQLLDSLKMSENKEKEYQNQIQSVPQLQEKIMSLEKILSDRSSSLHMGQKENSYKKVGNSHSNDYYNSKKKRQDTPPQYQGSPNKSHDKRTASPNILSNSKSVNKSKDQFKNSYQRFYNQVKHAREDSLRALNKDIRSIYSNSSMHTKATQQNSISISNNHQTDSHGHIRTISKDRDLKNISSSGNIINNNINNHKRSKSHQLSKVRGLNGHSKHTDHSRSSNQDFSEVQINGQIFDNHNIINNAKYK